jgi:hypothetical protein
LPGISCKCLDFEIGNWIVIYFSPKPGCPLVSMSQLSFADASPIRRAGTQYGTIKKIKTRKNQPHFVTLCNLLGLVYREGDVA